MYLVISKNACIAAKTDKLQRRIKLGGLSAPGKWKELVQQKHSKSEMSTIADHCAYGRPIILLLFAWCQHFDGYLQVI